jgi:hypothetical protein
MKRSFRIFLGIGIFLPIIAHADLSDYQKRAETSAGVELNLLWLSPPFRTVEAKMWVRVTDSVDFVFGYGHQSWTYDGNSMNRGKMLSDGLILGVRGYLFQTNTEVEYDTWLAHDRLNHENGKEYSGFSQSNEFFAGYQFYYGSSYTYSTAGLNAGFWAWKGYTTPIDDRFVPALLPKFFLGREVK